MKLTSSFVHEVKRIQVCQPFFLALALCLTTATALRAQLPNPAAYLTFDEGRRHSGSRLIWQQQ